jgi:hypothetical protein
MLIIMLVKILRSSKDGRILLGIYDTCTPRYGNHVEGADVHHNPTPGTVGSEWLYGHNFVKLAWKQFGLDSRLEAILPQR